MIKKLLKQLRIKRYNKKVKNLFWHKSNINLEYIGV